MISGFRTASELTLTFSAPASRTARMSSRFRIPPPTAKGMKTFFAMRRTISMSIGTPRAEAAMS